MHPKQPLLALPVYHSSRSTPTVHACTVIESGNNVTPGNNRRNAVLDLHKNLRTQTHRNIVSTHLAGRVENWHL